MTVTEFTNETTTEINSSAEETTDSNKTVNGRKLSGGEIAGICIGVVVGGVVVVVIVVLIIKAKTRVSLIWV